MEPQSGNRSSTVFDAATSSKKKINLSSCSSNKAKEAIVNAMLTKNKWEKNKQPVRLTLTGAHLFDSLFSRSANSDGDTSISNFDLGDNLDTATANSLLTVLVRENDSNLVEKILCTLFLHHSRKSLVVHRLSEMHLLMDNKSIELHSTILKNLAVLKSKQRDGCILSLLDILLTNPSSPQIISRASHRGANRRRKAATGGASTKTTSTTRRRTVSKAAPTTKRR